MSYKPCNTYLWNQFWQFWQSLNFFFEYLPNLIRNTGDFQTFHQYFASKYQYRIVHRVRQMKKNKFIEERNEDASKALKCFFV